MDPKVKKKVYILLWIITGAMLAVIVHGSIEIPVLLWANRGRQWHAFLGINDYLQFRVIDLWVGAVELILGMAFGFWIGKIAWRKVYIEGIRGKKYIIKDKT